MILPIYAYGSKILKKKAAEVEQDFPELAELIANMWETMYNANGVGLAAPQIGQSIRLFLVDTSQLDDDEDNDEKGIKQVFINAEKLEESGEAWLYEEGCLSIPKIRGDVSRPPTLRLRYLNEKFEMCETTFEGVNARVIQHEYDHIEGKLFTEQLKPVRRRLVKRRLENIKKGAVDVDYPMRFR